MRSLLRPLALLAGLSLSAPLWAEPQNPECIAPAAPGGGFDLACRLAQSGLKETGLLQQPLAISYMPGGVGAVAYNQIVTQRPAEEGTLVAFSTGSLLNIAQGKFGRFDEQAVRWLAVIGTSYGALAVRSDSPYRNLQDLVNDLKHNPDRVIIGTSGTIGGQDWLQLALVARAAGLNPRRLRYVALEGGGEIATALQGGHIQIGSTDISDSIPRVQSGQIRILAVFAPHRLREEPAMADIPTAREQGFDIVWPVLRGFYMGPQVSEAQYQWWKTTFDHLLASEDFAQLRDQRELFPLSLTGPELTQHIQEAVTRYRQMAREFDLIH